MNLLLKLTFFNNMKKSMPSEQKQDSSPQASRLVLVVHMSKLLLGLIHNFIKERVYFVDF